MKTLNELKATFFNRIDFKGMSLKRMNFKSSPLKALSVMSLGIMSLTACNDTGSTKSWSVDNEQSNIHFSSTKNGDVNEQHSFKTFSGTLDANGDFTIEIDLSSVDTGIEIRDERLQEHVFNSKKQPKATITGIIDPKLLESQDATSYTANAVLDLAGTETRVEAKVSINYDGTDNITVSTDAPITLSTKELGVKAGVDKLQEIAGLKSISDEVPVNFSLTFTQ